VKHGTLSYINRRGAGVCVHGPLHELAQKLKTLRCEATLRVDGQKEPIGGVVDLESDAWRGADDKRVRWNWWYDADLCREDA
jgi:hypothetical protein